MPRKHADSSRPELGLSREERKQLEKLGRNASNSTRRLRALIVLECETGASNRTVARRLGRSEATVAKWRERFRSNGLRGLRDRPRIGAPRKIKDDQIHKVLTKSLYASPIGTNVWSTRLMAGETLLAQTAVSRIWRAFRVRPGRGLDDRFSRTPSFLERVTDVVGLYLSPPHRVLALTVSEAVRFQVESSRATSASSKPAQNTNQNRLNREVLSKLVALDLASGRLRQTSRRPDRNNPLHERYEKLLAFLGKIYQHAPSDNEIHLVMDNYRLHSIKSVRRWLERHRHCRNHFCPTWAQWVDVMLRVCGQLKERDGGAWPSLQALEENIQNFLQNGTAKPRPFIWTRGC